MSATVINRPNQSLWKNNKANGKLACVDALPTVSMSQKLFDVPFTPAQRTAGEMARIGYNADPSKKFLWLYEEQVRNLLGNRTQPNGLETLTNGEMDAIAQTIVNMNAEYIITDHEGEPAWWEWPSWTYAGGQKISYISNKVDQLSGGTKKYFDWFHKQFFTFNTKQLGFLTDNGTFQANGNGSTVDDYLAFFANPGGASNQWNSSPMARCGWGYTSITYRPDNAGGSVLPANIHFAPINSYLLSLNGINAALSINPNRTIVYVVWPKEDFDRVEYRQARFKPKSLDNSVNPSGMVRMRTNRLTYPSNLVTDNIYLACCNPKVKRLHAWIKPNSEDPADIMRYAKRNGNHACSSSLLTFDVANYVGNDNPPCNITNGDYYGEEAIGFNAIMAGINRFAAHQDILDGTQVKSCPAFAYKRDGDVAFTNVAAITDNSEKARSHKFRQPFIEVWTKGTKHVVNFQMPFAEAFEPIVFQVTVAGTAYEYTANGNEVFAFRID